MSRRVGLLRDCLVAINARFHLVGIYTLIDLLLLILLAVAGEEPEWGPAVMAALVLAGAATAGILGAVYHAASGRPGKPSFPVDAARFFLPLLWLQLKLRLLVYAPMVLFATAWRALADPSISLQDWMARAVFLWAPVAESLILLFLLYSAPIAMLRRERGERGAPVREGLHILATRKRDSLRLLFLLLPAVALSATLHYVNGPEKKEPVPDLPEAFALMVTSYLTLAAFFGACRVVLAWAGGGSGPGRATDSAANAPGPAA